MLRYFRAFLTWWRGQDFTKARHEASADLRKVSFVLFMLALVFCPWLPGGAVGVVFAILNIAPVVEVTSSPVVFWSALVVAFLLRSVAFVLRAR